MESLWYTSRTQDAKTVEEYSSVGGWGEMYSNEKNEGVCSAHDGITEKKEVWKEKRN